MKLLSLKIKNTGLAFSRDESFSKSIIIAFKKPAKIYQKKNTKPLFSLIYNLKYHFIEI
ncbi:hypothetical protein PI23P_12077 [Polaribacter irgensii 23-P]|uniref:Uncharacterized protein n=1 Tax=Polaribacter irgensii 23-P TaxID=313594 RepID=A4C1R8_9FLAO|nr:hypothetical protein PI23P_12077 [Polaribacter irgensii 23-P]